MECICKGKGCAVCLMTPAFKLYVSYVKADRRMREADQANDPKGATFQHGKRTAYDTILQELFGIDAGSL